MKKKDQIKENREIMEKLRDDADYDPTAWSALMDLSAKTIKLQEQLDRDRERSKLHKKKP